jgi:hypothetical protein
MSYGELLKFLTTLDDAVLDKPVRTFVAAQCLVVNRVHEGDGDDPPRRGLCRNDGWVRVGACDDCEAADGAGCGPDDANPVCVMCNPAKGYTMWPPHRSEAQRA